MFRDIQFVLSNYLSGAGGTISVLGNLSGTIHKQTARPVNPTNQRLRASARRRKRVSEEPETVHSSTMNVGAMKVQESLDECKQSKWLDELPSLLTVGERAEGAECSHATLSVQAECRTLGLTLILRKRQMIGRAKNSSRMVCA